MGFKLCKNSPYLLKNKSHWFHQAHLLYFYAAHLYKIPLAVIKEMEKII